MQTGTDALAAAGNCANTQDYSTAPHHSQMCNQENILEHHLHSSAQNQSCSLSHPAPASSHTPSAGDELEHELSLLCFTGWLCDCRPCPDLSTFQSSTCCPSCSHAVWGTRALHNARGGGRQRQGLGVPALLTLAQPEPPGAGMPPSPAQPLHSSAFLQGAPLPAAPSREHPWHGLTAAHRGHFHWGSNKPTGLSPLHLSTGSKALLWGSPLLPILLSYQSFDKGIYTTEM